MTKDSDNKKTYIGIDNGVTGSVALIIGDKHIRLFKIPVIKQQDYTKSKKQISRLDVHKFYNILLGIDNKHALAVIERPMVNPGRFKATVSAVRCLEACLICLETLKIPYKFIDSKEWQKEFLPKNIKKEELKRFSKLIGIRHWPFYLKDEIDEVGDADALWIAYYARLKNW